MLHDQDTTAHTCPCGSGQPFNQCCEPAIEGVKPATTAEQLMRSRYTAFALGMSDYLIDSTHPDYRQGLSREMLDEQNASTQWRGLTILDTEGGQEQDHQGKVAFIAEFSSPDQHAQLQEQSNFLRQDGLWYYLDGDVSIRPIKPNKQ